MLNGLFITVTLLSVLIAAATGRMEALTGSIVTSARNAVELAIGLVGVMAFFLGLMRVAEKGGVMATVARLVRPVMHRLFPDVPADHPAISAMILNISANMAGTWKRRHPFRHQGNSGVEQAEQPSRHRDERHDALPRDQHGGPRDPANRHDRRPCSTRIR